MKTKHSNISIFTKGNPQKPSLLFVHGFPYDHHMWDKIVDELSKDYYCVSFDIRGLGSSDAGDGQYTMEIFSDDLFSIIDQKELNNPVLCGLSMGGYISLRAVERNQNKFKALILLDTKSEADTNQNKLKRAQAINIINNKGLDAFLQEFIPTCFAEESIKELGEDYEAVFNRSRKYSPAGVKGCLLAMAARTDTTESLDKIEIPVLVICGEKDKLTPPETMEEMSRKIKNSRFAVIGRSGHMTPIERPDAVLEHMKTFLKSLDSV
jgi:3-oxoadipate enol-lactonase